MMTLDELAEMLTAAIREMSPGRRLGSGVSLCERRAKKWLPETISPATGGKMPQGFVN
jgi:hypothetical protein